MSDQVNHPVHYNKEGRKECIVEMQERYGAEYTAVFALLSAYKYGYRAGDKEGNPGERDMGKAEWYSEYVDNKLLPYIEDSVLKNENFCRLLLDIKEMLGKSTKITNCNLTMCLYNENGKCTNEEKRKECVEVSRKVLCWDDNDY